MESIKFSNFKGFGGEHSIDVADLTLIYGENSAGKSSLLELLRLAWTTSSCEELGYDPDLGEVEGPLSLAHRRHQFGKRITITRSGMDCGRVGDGPWTRSITTEWAFEPEEMGLAREAMFAPHKIEYDTAHGKVTGRATDDYPGAASGLGYFAFLLNRAEVRRFLESAIQESAMHQVNTSLMELIWSYWDDLYGDAQHEMTALELLDVVKPALWSTSTKIWVDSGFFHADGDFDNWTRRAIEMLLIGHLESAAPDFLVDRGQPEGGEWGWGAGYAVRIPAIRPPIPDHITKEPVTHLNPDEPWAYLNWITNNVEELKNSYGVPIGDRVAKRGLNEFNAALERLGVPHSLRLRDNEFPTNKLAVWFKDRRSGTLVRPGGVGSGVAQVIPVIAACEFCGDRTLVSIEQPELHLHPRLQANLGEYLVEAARTRSSDAAPLIVETHSELLILRVLRMIREGQADPSKVAIYYVGNTAEGPQITQMRIGPDGEFIDEWPDGFFEERLDELF